MTVNCKKMRNISFCLRLIRVDCPLRVECKLKCKILVTVMVGQGVINSVDRLVLSVSFVGGDEIFIVECSY
jgi:hypothetical protein